MGEETKLINLLELYFLTRHFYNVSDYKTKTMKGICSAHRVIYDETLGQQLYYKQRLYCFRFEIVSLQSIICNRTV